MSVEGVQQGLQPQFSGATAAGAAEGGQGVFMGHEVALEDSPMSLIADAAEELGFALDKTQDYELSQRKLREKTEVSEKLLEVYRKLMHKVGSAKKADQLIDALKRAGSRQAMRQALQGAFPDPTDAWGVLLLAREAFEADAGVTRAQKAQLQALCDEYFQENGQAIRLGLRGAVEGERFPELGGFAQTRDLYRHTVGEFAGVQEVFAEIQQKYGDAFEKAMDFLFAAISSDIESDVPSMDRSHLESVHGKLALVRLTQSAYRLCEDVVRRWSEVHVVSAPALTPMGLLGDIVSLTRSSYVSASQVEGICRKAGAPDIEHEVLFAQELLAAVRKFPVALFGDEQKYGAVKDAVQAVVDGAIEREDEYLASQE